MPVTIAELAAQGKALSPEERIQLIDILLASLHEGADPAIEAAWEAEVQRRVDKYARGEGKAYDAEDVMAEAMRLAP